jgi:hypothetical protein
VVHAQAMRLDEGTVLNNDRYLKRGLSIQRTAACNEQNRNKRGIGHDKLFTIDE